MAGRIPQGNIDIEVTSTLHRVLDEVALLLIVLAVPMSYLVGVCGQSCPGCAGSGNPSDVEMEKMDKIYQEVSPNYQLMLTS